MPRLENGEVRGGDGESETPDWPPPGLIEGVHFYHQDGLIVFTAAYHRARGHCCGSDCLHCPYDHVDVE